MAKKFEYEIVERVAVLSTNGEESKELNRISFQGREPKYDLRTWRRDENGDKMLKGITLTEEELQALKDALNAR